MTSETVEAQQHWLTSTALGWECTHPTCDWHWFNLCVDHGDALELFDGEHAEMAEADGN